MKTPKRQFPEMPTCPICGGELADEMDDREYHFDSYIYCKNDSDHLTVGVDITEAEYEKLKETYFRIQSLDDVYIVDNGKDLICARWKRKNREAQLKHTIARLKQELAKTKQDLYVCESCIEVYESAAEGEKWNAAIWKKEATALVARFGQDIEGS